MGGVNLELLKSFFAIVEQGRREMITRHFGRLFAQGKKEGRVRKDVPMERPGQPDEVAPAYIYLASEDSSYMSGQTLHVNGGVILV